MREWLWNQRKATTGSTLSGQKVWPPLLLDNCARLFWVVGRAQLLWFWLQGPEHSKPQFSSVQFSHSVMSNSLQPHGPHHTRPPCPSPTPGVYLNSCLLSRWCHPTISSSLVAFSSRLQSFPASGIFRWISSSHQVAKVLEFELQHQSFQWTLKDWSLGRTGWISLWFKGLSRVFSNTTVQKQRFFGAQLPL